MNCEECRNHLLEYLYEELDDQVRKGVEHALTECDDCKRELAALREMMKAADQFKRIPLAEPSARMSQNILREARVRAMEKTERASVPLWLAWAGPAFGLALAFVAVVVGVRATSTSDRASQVEAPTASADHGVSATTTAATAAGAEPPAEEEAEEGLAVAVEPDEPAAVERAVADSRYDRQQEPVGAPVPDSTVRAENRDSLTNAVPAPPRVQSPEIADQRPTEIGRLDRARTPGTLAVDETSSIGARGTGGLAADDEAGRFGAGIGTGGGGSADGEAPSDLAQGQVAAQQASDGNFSGLTPSGGAPAAAPAAAAPTYGTTDAVATESASTGSGRNRPSPRRSRSESTAASAAARPAEPYLMPEPEPEAVAPREPTPTPAPTPAPAPPTREADEGAVIEESQADFDSSRELETYGQRNVTPSVDDSPAAEQRNEAAAPGPAGGVETDTADTDALTVASLLESGDVDAAVRRSEELLAQNRSATNIYWAARARLDDGDDVSARLLAGELHTRFPQDTRYEDLRERIASPIVPATRGRTRMLDSTTYR